jgi:hypothetical protein
MDLSVAESVVAGLFASRVLGDLGRNKKERRLRPFIKGLRGSLGLGFRVVGHA